MGRRRGQVQEEGFGIGRRITDVLGRLVGENVGVEVFGLPPMRDHLAVLVGPVIVRPLFIQLDVPLVPAGRDVGWILFAVPVEVLAEQSGSVAALLEEGSDGVLLVSLVAELLKAPVRGYIALH